MSYVNRGLGGMDRTAAATKCGTKYCVTSPDFQPCVEHYASGASGEYGASPGLFDKFMSTMFPAPVAPAPQPGMTPAQVQAMIAAQKSDGKSDGMSQNTMIALGLGAVGLLAVVMIASRK
jgi:threonine dehydrogenase-like Zn-dependent dehydrogenase